MLFRCSKVSAASKFSQKPTNRGPQIAFSADQKPTCLDPQRGLIKTNLHFMLVWPECSANVLTKLVHSCCTSSAQLCVRDKVNQPESSILENYPRNVVLLKESPLLNSFAYLKRTSLFEIVSEQTMPQSADWNLEHWLCVSNFKQTALV